MVSMRVWVAVVAAAVFSVFSAPVTAPFAGESAAVSVPGLTYTTRTLKNGLKVYLMQDRTSPNVTVQVWYDVGSKHDPEGRSGFAHLFEHILSRKTRNMPLNMVNQLTEDVGGVRNASTGDDRTNYFEIVPAAYLETMLWTHAERMARPVVDTQVFETERGVVKEELRQRYLAPTYGRLFGFVITENCYDTLPNRRPGIGNIAELDAASLEDARGFHEAFYGPDTATLIVSGNFDQALLDKWIDKYFAPIPKRRHPASLAIDGKQPARTAARAVTAYAPNVPLPAVASVWTLPGVSHPDAPALSVIDAILARGDSSRLQNSLVNGTEIASEVFSNFELQEDGGCLAPGAIVASGKTVEAAETGLKAELSRLREQPVTAAELAEAKNELLAEDLRQRETFAGRAFLLGEALVQTGDPAWPDKMLAAIQAVTVEDVQRVARTYLTDATRVDVRYVDEGLRPAGEADNWRNSVPMPKFAPLPAAKGTANELAPEGQREAPPGPGISVPVTPPNIAEQVLPNGLKVISAKTGDVPLAAVTLVIGGGSATDPANKSGLAAMTALVMTKGTTTRSAEQIAAAMESLGAEIGVQTGPDSAALSIVAPSANIDQAVAIFADVVRNPTFPETEFARERKNAVDNWSVTLKNPGAVAGLAAQRAMYGAAPYGAANNGTGVSLLRLKRTDLADDHKRWWRPENATLVVTGAVDTAQSNALAVRVFGDWAVKGTTPALPKSRAGAGAAPRTIVIDLPGAGQAAVSATVRALKRSDPDFYALAAANAVLGAGSNGRLFQEVRVKRALSYGSYSTLASRLDVAVISASAQTKNESAADVAKVILAELERLKSEPLSETAIEKRKTFLTGGFNRQVQTAGGLGGTIAGLVQQGMPAREVVDYPGKLAAVTAAAATGIAQRIAGSDQATLVVVGDASKFLEAMKALRPNIEVIKSDELDLESPTLRKRR
ncbi:MAG: insulinase family protein [Alphaproteobacteria bacterium]|nr:insulinase family protein [Alphaproteobacteria bacterium]